MTDVQPGPGRDVPYVRLFVRRLPDVKTRFRTRPSYEVGWCQPGESTPSRIEPTQHPEKVLRDAGEHATDIWDYMRGADEAWTGGVGPWRGLHPYVTP